MKDNTRTIKCKCCGKEIKSDNKIVEREDYGYVYSVEHYESLETFINKEEGKEVLGECFCKECYENLDWSIRVIEVANGQQFLDNIKNMKEELEEECLKKIKQLENRASRIERNIEIIKEVENMSDLSLEQIYVMREDEYPESADLLLKYKKSIPIKPIIRVGKVGYYEDSYKCPVCKNYVYSKYNKCGCCSQTIDWSE